MRPPTLEAGERAGHRASAQARSSSTRDEAHAEQYSGWALEDIDAPETWTLASFDDLVPLELA